jgi:CO/xanthine dehydrogenase Mo-binding subunit
MTRLQVISLAIEVVPPAVAKVIYLANGKLIHDLPIKNSRLV